MSPTRLSAVEHVRPRPITRIPDLAPVAPRKRTAALLESTFGLSPKAARTLADSVVDHTKVAAAIKAPERRRVPGGELIMVPVEAYSVRLGYDSANMRTAQHQVHPFAVTPGTGAENSRFAPVRPPTSDPSGYPELRGDVESRPHLEWAYGRAAEFVLAHNNWAESIAAQGVMESVWVTPVHYTHADGGDDLVIPQSSEGSSRVTATHHLLGKVFDLDSGSVAYGMKDTSLRSWITQLNDRMDLGTMDADWEAAARAFIIPALFIVGFDPADPADPTPFHVAVQSLVALRHVDPPAPWGEAAEMEALADGVLDELERRRIIPRDKRRWLAGAMTRDEAAAAHLSDDPAVRAAHIIELFTSPTPSVQHAIRAAVTAQSTRRQIRSKLKDQLATALIMRATTDGDRNRERIRKYMREGIAQDWHRRPWKATQRSVDDLERAALAEASALTSIDAEPGPATLELAARSTFPLITGLHLHADRGTANNDQPDRRNPGAVLEAMRRSPHGVRQLARALRDGAAGNRVVLVDENGSPEVEGTRAVVVADAELRARFPHGSKTVRPTGPIDSPAKRLAVAISDLSETVGKLTESMDAVKAVKSDRGGAHVAEVGVPSAYATAWIDELEAAKAQLMEWRIIAGLHSPAPVDDADDDADDGLRVEDLAGLTDDELADEAERHGITSYGADRDELLDKLTEAILADDEDTADDAEDDEVEVAVEPSGARR